MIYKYFGFLLLLLFSVSAEAQTESKSIKSILWFGLEHPVHLMDSTLVLKHPFIKSDDATAIFDKNGTVIVFVTNSKSVGDTIQLDLFDSLPTGIRKISSYNFLVKRTPDPVFSIGGKLIHDTISRSDLLKSKKINVALDDVDFDLNIRFELQSFDLEIDGKVFHSNSNELTNSMIYLITNTKGNTIRIINDKTILSNLSDKTARCVLPGCDKTFVLGK